MTSLPERAAIAVVRAWTTVYTLGLPAADRERRRDEIDSDLWESLVDPARKDTNHAFQIMARLIAGIPDDVLWRADHVQTAGRRIWRVALTAIAIAMLGLWLNRSTRPEPSLDQMIKLIEERKYGPRLIDPPPPPPPPPPPCAPNGLPQPSGRCTR